MTRKQAINYLHSTGMAYAQIREIVEALSKPYKGEIRVGDVVFVNPSIGVVVGVTEACTGNQMALVIDKEGFPLGAETDLCVKTGRTISIVQDAMDRLKTVCEEELKDGE